MSVVLVVLLAVAGRTAPRLLVQAPAGSVRGVPAPDGDYVMFLGIPYATVNASNPFGASIPQKKFDKVFDASVESAICPQFKEIYTEKNVARYEGTLDCLRLNVFVPDSLTKHRAVYMFTFGGRFDTGHSEMGAYGPRYLVRHDIVVVTFNFRVGPYGFLCADTPEVPGNQGLRDQYDAMRWVRDNIRAFGGDPHRITLGGHSSGAMSVDMHLLTRRPRLFQRAILQSGTATTPGFLGPSDPMALVNIARKIGFETDDASAALSFLARASPRVVVEATAHEYKWAPCLERKFEGVTPYIDENPELAAGVNVDGLSVLGGFTDREFVYNLYRPNYESIFSRPDGFRSVLEQKFDLRNDSELVDIVRRFYLADDGDPETRKYEIVDLLSDFNFVYPVQRQLIKYSRRRNATVYLYVFAYDGRLNRMKRILDVTEAGATHSDELGYMFSMDFIPDPPNGADRRVIDRLTTLWANFVKYGTPTPARTALLPVLWPPLSAGAAPALRIDTDLTVVSRPFRRRVAFWDLFYDAHLDKLTTAAAARE